jgi:hypothetical protein
MLQNIHAILKFKILIVKWQLNIWMRIDTISLVHQSTFVFTISESLLNCSACDQFLSRGRLLTDKLMLEGFLQSRLISAFRRFSSRYNNLINNYKLLLSHILSDIFIPIVRSYLAYWFWQRITPHSWSWNWAHGGCDLSTEDAFSS